MSRPQPILALDFDGVLCDTTEECVVAAWNAWLAYRGRDGFVRRPEQVPEPYLGTLRRLRKFVRTAGEYYVALQVAEAGHAVERRADFELLVHRLRQPVAVFAERVFAARGRLRDEDETHWIRLHRIYPGIPDQLRQVWPHFETFVVTGKDRETVKLFTRQFGLTLSEQRIYDRDSGHDKLSVIRGIAGRHHRSLAEVHVLDDNIHHLLPLHAAGCVALMAAWGYHTDEDLLLAQEHGVPRVSLESWPETLLANAVGDEGARRESV